MAGSTLAPSTDDRHRARLCLAATLLIVTAVALLELARLPGDGLPMYDEAAHFIEAQPFRDALAAGDLRALLELGLADAVKGLIHSPVHAVALLAGGQSLHSLRVAGVAGLLLSLLLLYPLGRLASGPARDPLVGLLAVGFAAASPLLLDWGRSAMVEPLNLALNLLAFIAVLRDGERRSAASAAVAALALLVAFAVKFNQGLILFGAVAACGALDVLQSAARRTATATSPSVARSWRALRPLLPVALAAGAIGLFLLWPGRWEDFRHYLTTVKGGGDPVRFELGFYPRTLVERFLPWSGAALLFALCFVAGLRAALRPGTRVLLAHVALGVLLASFNASKRVRLLMPLAPGLVVTAALGARLLWARLPLRAGPSTLAAGALALVYVLPGRFALFENRIGAPPGLERVLDAGLELQADVAPTLWIGGCAVEGEPRLSAPYVQIRALESGHPAGERRVAYLDATTGPRLERAGLSLAQALAQYPQLVVVSDAAPGAPGSSAPDGNAPVLGESLAQRVEALLQGGSGFVQAGTRTVALPSGGGGPPLSVSVTLWRRVAR